MWRHNAMFTAVFLGVGIIVLPPDEPHPNPYERHFDGIGDILLALALGLLAFHGTKLLSSDGKNPMSTSF